MPPRTAPNRGGPRGARGGQTPLAPGVRGGGAGRGSRSDNTPQQVTGTNRGGFRGARGGHTPPVSGGRGGGGGGGGGRGRRPSHAPVQTTEDSPNPITLSVRSDLKTIGVKRPNFGTAGRVFPLEVNSFEITAKDNDIFHYDAVSPDSLSGKRKFVLFQHLQDEYPTIFTPKLVYDGQKMAYSTKPLNFGPENARQFDVSFPRTAGSDLSRPPSVFNMKLTKVATIKTEILRSFICGRQSWDEGVESALMAYNIAIRTDPNLNNPYRGRSFYSENDRWNIGGGFEVWRGIFQSVRPVIGRLVVNIDLTATIMYRDGPLTHVINDFYGRPTSQPPTYLVPGHSDFPPEYHKVRLQRFLNGLRVVIKTTGTSSRAITGLTNNGANAEYFQLRDGGTISVAQYFGQVGLPLQYPNAICVKIGSMARVPLEMCTVLRGQFANNGADMGPDQVSQILRFATKKPVERMEAIKAGIEHLQFNQSDYIAQFGLTIKKEPLQIQSRIINPPTMRYSEVGAQAIMVPRDGTWNMVDKQFIRPGSIHVWAIAAYDYRLGKQMRDIIKAFQNACKRVGIKMDNEEPVVRTFNPQGKIEQQLKSLGADCIKKHKNPPSVIVVILPEGAGDLYTSVKRFGNVTFGVVTQCLRARQCTRAKDAYWANVMLKVNVKLGGINAIPESGVMDYISDPANPTIVIGADVMHPAPNSGKERPSIAAVVGSVDTSAAKYTGTTSVQKGRMELIAELKNMCKFVLENYTSYRKDIEQKVGNDTLKPKRLIFYRDGVSEGEFTQVLNQELPLVRQACEELGMNPKITFIVVRKKHHNQMFPLNNVRGNAPAGTVIDTVITHPTDFDFFLQSHAGILGTSRPAHYSVLHDEIGFNADALQALSFTLCHVYAPATRSVSIPAPVYYADKMCINSRVNFVDDVGSSDAGSQASGQVTTTLQTYKSAFKPAHQNQQTRMYFV